MLLAGLVFLNGPDRLQPAHDAGLDPGRFQSVPGGSPAGPNLAWMGGTALTNGSPLTGPGGVPARTAPDPHAQVLARRLAAAFADRDRADLDPAPALPPVPNPDHPRPDLVPPPARFTEAQLARLAELRWRSGKQLEVRGNARNNTLRLLEGLSLEPPAGRPDPGQSLAATTASRFLERNRDLLLVADPIVELAAVREVRDDLGYTQIRYEQQYQGLRVWPASLTVQVDPAGHAHWVAGAYVPTPEQVTLEPGIDPGLAADLARRSLGLDPVAPIESQELILHAPAEGPIQLAYKVDLHASPLAHWQVVVDATSGAILDSMNQVCTAVVQGSGIDMGGQVRPLNLWSRDNRFHLVDATKPMFDAARSTPPSPGTTFGGIVILDARGVDPAQNPDAYAPEVVASASATGGFPAAGVSAAFNLSIVHDYFLQRHQRNSIDGQGGTIIGIVNVPVDNAFWHQGVITLGSGDAWADSLDFVGHEMAHGVTERTAGLIYRDQSGAMNEAFSDILGESAEAFHRGQTDWQLGSQMSRRIRNMRDPQSFIIADGRRFPARMSQFITPNDPFLDRFPGRNNGGVHFNSSIINHAYYQLAEGLPDAIGIARAERIFYRALTTKLQQQSQFIDCRWACVQSAIELFGPGSPEAIRTGEAFNAVEIFDQSPTPGPTPIPTIQGPDALVFTYVDALNGLTFLARREAALGDPVSGVVLSPGVAMAPGKRPALMGDGSAVMVVTANNDIALVNTQTGQGQSLGFVGQVWSVGMSSDGQWAAIILRDAFGQPRNQINVIRLGTSHVETYNLLAPTLDGGSLATVLYGDSLDFSIDGNFLYYDALNRLRFSDGSVFDNWSIYVIDRTTGLEFEVVRPIPGLNIGNPALGHIHNHRLVFEAQNPANATSTLYGMDVVSGRIGALFTVNSTLGVGYPRLNGDDSVLYFTDYFFNGAFFSHAIIGTIGVTPDGLSFSGDASPTLTGNAAGPLIGAVYRRGTFAGLPEVRVAATIPVTAPGSSTLGRFTLTRTGSADRSLPVSFLLTGTARNGVDYFGVPLTATFPAGAATTTVSILAFANTGRVGDATAILTLSPASHYLVGSPDAATVTLQGGDTPGNAFEQWAREQGVTGEHNDDDRDGYSNLMEFALGTDPRIPDPPNLIRGTLLTVGADRHLALSVERRARNPAIQYGVEVADDLAGPWMSGPPHTLGIEDSPTRLTVRDTTALAARPKRFMRLKVSLLDPPP
ncbi:MAG: M4 family metallopeptidase [Verrucomicrobiae bacterium]|nr:M4 family metallopeptidase [Verrucomicrobiae bacterium]